MEVLSCFRYRYNFSSSHRIIPSLWCFITEQFIPFHLHVRLLWATCTSHNCSLPSKSQSVISCQSPSHIYNFLPVSLAYLLAPVCYFVASSIPAPAELPNIICLNTLPHSFILLIIFFPPFFPHTYIFARKETKVFKWVVPSSFGSTIYHASFTTYEV